MQTESTHNLLPSQVVVQPVLALTKKGVGQYDQNDRQQSNIRFMGYGYDIINNEPLYGPSGKQAQTSATCGEFVDLYV